MSKDLLIIVILLLVNLIVALIYLLFHIGKDDSKKGLINYFTFLVFPIVGFVFMGLSELANLIVFQRFRKEISYDELSFSKTRMKLVQDTDVDKSMDSVPLEEALLMSNKQDKRQSLMDVLKKDDYTDMIKGIQYAVSSNDKEVSHYAATFVTDTIARYKARELELRGQMEKNPSAENLSTYINYVRDMLDSDLFTGLEKERYVNICDTAATLLYENFPENFLDSYATSMLKYSYEELDFDKIKKWLTIIGRRSSESLECFKTYAAFCFALEKKDAFFRTLDRVKHSNVVLDSEALEWIRFFS